MCTNTYMYANTCIYGTISYHTHIYFSTHIYLSSRPIYLSCCNHWLNTKEGCINVKRDFYYTSILRITRIPGHEYLSNIQFHFNVLKFFTRLPTTSILAFLTLIFLPVYCLLNRPILSVLMYPFRCISQFNLFIFMFIALPRYLNNSRTYSLIISNSPIYKFYKWSTIFVKILLSHTLNIIILFSFDVLFLFL